MLVELEIENLAVVRHARVPFGPGLVALTGATGAGKSVILRALDLVTGARAAKADGACTVTALFQVDADARAAVQSALGPAGLEDDDLVIARKIGPDGRSRAWINGQIAPLQTIRAVGERLVDVLGQGDARRLSAVGERAALLDGFGGSTDLAQAYRGARDAARDAAERRARLRAAARDRRRRLEFLRFEQSDIDAAGVRPGESDALDRELQILESAESLRTLSRDAIDTLYENDGAVVDRLASLERQCGGLSSGAADLLRPALSALARARAEIEDAVASFRDALDRADVDPRRLESVRDRSDTVRRVLDRFGPSEAELLAHVDAIEQEFEALTNEENDEEEADRTVEAAEAALEQAAESLRTARARAGGHLETAVAQQLEALGMEGARFSVRLVPHDGTSIRDRAHAHGTESVEFFLGANVGLEARPLSEVASGGETARIALALRRATATARAVPVLVFDEIDSGIGARLGEAVARCLQEIATERQVLVVTHLPQVAAFASRHLKVAKATKDGRTDASVESLDGPAREKEIAEMMRGADAAGTTRREARDLLHRAEGAS